MRSIKARFILFMAIAAVAPLLAYGVLSVASLVTSTRQSVTAGNLNVAERAAEQIDQYLESNIKILRALAADLHDTHQLQWQQNRILKNYALDFPELREVTLFDKANVAIATSRLDAPRLAPPSATLVGSRGVWISPVSIDADLLPTTTIAVRLRGAAHADDGWLVGELSLEELWHLVDRIRVGNEGFAVLATQEGRLIAHGNPDEKRRVASGAGFAAQALIDGARLQTSDPGMHYFNADGVEMLGVVSPVDGPGWWVVVEQPTHEAYAIATRTRWVLIGAALVALVVSVGIGFRWGRHFISRILAVKTGTQAIADGRLEERVHVDGNDEVSELGNAFNSMADRLVELTENVRKQERQAMFGRIAAGLVHDISHPIQNIGNSCKLILKMHEDLEYRDLFRRTVDRELAAIKRVLEDLRNVARPIPLERFPLDLNRTIAEVIETMRPVAETAGLTIAAELTPATPYIEGDVFALGRVYRNLILNALQATAPGGSVTVTTAAIGERARVVIADTGCGIPADRLPKIFDDFVTTKRRGLGLGLAISKKIIEQLGGGISVVSEINRGTTFTLDFPATAARPMAMEAAG
ncbi:MAG: sensor histidine kinase [Acidobacteriota bacterium]|nr:sensor histidine kinase [Acidobacteriota bacterium]